MQNPEKYEPPEPGGVGKMHSLVKAAISAIPYLGGPGVELFQLVVMPPLEKRRNEWMDDVAIGLRELEAKQKIVLEKLSSDDYFLDTVLHCTQLVLRNSQDEKRIALRNAVLNSALPNRPEQSLQQMFLNYVDSFTVWHIKLLKLFRNPKKWFEENGKTFPNLISGGLGNILEEAYSELRGRRDLYDQLWSDLAQRGLAGPDSLHVMMTASGLTSKRTTDMGDLFIAFIEEPTLTLPA